MTLRPAPPTSPGLQPRARRVADGVTVFLGLVFVIWGIVGIERQSPLETELMDLAGLLPSWVNSLMALVYSFGLLYALGVFVTLLLGGPGRRSAVRDVTVTVLGASVMALVLGLWVTGEIPYIFPEIALDNPTPRFPVVRVMLVVAVVAVSSPHLGRPLRRFGWLMISLMAIAAISLGYGQASDAIGGLGIGLIAAGTVLLVFGSPRGYPHPDTVADALGRMGLAVTDVRVAPEQSWGVRRFTASHPGIGDLTVKVYGRDASDSQFVAKVWRTLWYREDSRTLAYSRLQAVEHEALVTMVAGRAGVSVPDVVATGQATPELALVATTFQGVMLDAVDAADITDDVLIEVWRHLAKLHGAGISHGSLTPATVATDGARPTLTDFALGTLVADDADRSEDIVELLFSSSLTVGVDRAVRAAVAGLGVPAIASALPYLQLPAVSAGTRKQAAKPRTAIKELQAAVVEATAQQLPEPVKLRRVTPRTLLMLALLLFAAAALIPMLTGVDFAEVADELRTAHWGVIAAGLVVGQTMFIPQTTGMMFAVAKRLPFWPLAVLQVAIEFIGLAVPSVAGRIAMNAAFLRKYGVSLATSVAQGMIDSFAGFLIEITILLIAIFSGGVDFGLDLQPEDIPWELVLVIGALVIVGAIVAVVKVKALKDRVRPVITQGRDALMGVVKDPSRALGLLGSNLATRLVWAATLWLMLSALGVPIGYVMALVAVVATNVLQGVIPVPGGVGVSEAVMTGFLVAFGVDETAAFAAAVLYRIVTFYLPAVEGFFAMRWLERNGHL